MVFMADHAFSERDAGMTKCRLDAEMDEDMQAIPACATLTGRRDFGWTAGVATCVAMSIQQRGKNGVYTAIIHADSEITDNEQYMRACVDNLNASCPDARAAKILNVIGGQVDKQTAAEDARDYYTLADKLGRYADSKQLLMNNFQLPACGAGIPGACDAAYLDFYLRMDGQVVVKYR